MKAKKSKNHFLSTPKIIIILAALVLFFGFIITPNKTQPHTSKTGPDISNSDKAIYKNEEAGFMFTYPEEWGLPGRERDFAFQPPSGEPRKSEEKKEGTESGVQYEISFNTKPGIVKITVNSDDYSTFHPSGGGPIHYGPTATRDMILTKIQEYRESTPEGIKIIKISDDAYTTANFSLQHRLEVTMDAYRVVEIPKMKASAVHGVYEITTNSEQRENCTQGELSPSDKEEFCLTQKKADHLEDILASFEPYAPNK